MRFSKAKIIFIFFGLLDFGAFIDYLVSAVRLGEVPFFQDVEKSISLSHDYGSSLPLVLSSISLILIISTVISGILYIINSRRVIVIVYLQFVVRVALYYPSIFFLPKIFTMLGISESNYYLYYLIFALLEVFKVLYTRQKIGK